MTNPVTRYRIAVDAGFDTWGEPDPDGEWVKYEDVKHLLAPTQPSEPKAEPAVHEAITRALAEAGVKQEVLVGMCIEVGLEAYRDALNRGTEPTK